jgi:hypothetical protein
VLRKDTRSELRGQLASTTDAYPATIDATRMPEPTVTSFEWTTKLMIEIVLMR